MTRTGQLQRWLLAEQDRLRCELDSVVGVQAARSTDVLEQAETVRHQQARARREERVRRRMADVEAALERHADGTLGTCEAFGDRIDAERLATVPTTRLCRRDAGCR